MFSRSDYLNIHMQKKHPEMIIAATNLTAATTTPSSGAQQQVASAPTHYTCAYCDRIFERANALANHVKMHERNNAAAAAAAAAANNSAANSLHITSQTTLTPIPNGTTGGAAPAGGRKYLCSICHISFDIPKDLRNHIITSHPF